MQGDREYFLLLGLGAAPHPLFPIWEGFFPLFGVFEAGWPQVGKELPARPCPSSPLSQHFTSCFPFPSTRENAREQDQAQREEAAASFPIQLFQVLRKAPIPIAKHRDRSRCPGAQRSPHTSGSPCPARPTAFSQEISIPGRELRQKIHPKGFFLQPGSSHLLPEASQVGFPVNPSGQGSSLSRAPTAPQSPGIYIPFYMESTKMGSHLLKQIFPPRCDAQALPPPPHQASNFNLKNVI